VLKPDGLLVITVDFTPMSESGKDGQLEYRLARLARLAQRGDIGEILRGGARKVGARLSVAGGAARKPRSANECFTADHLELDVLPLLSGTPVENSLSFPAGLRSVTRGQARAFWNLRPGLFELQGQRDVLPAAVALRRVSA
jgi:hypothetical protein